MVRNIWLIGALVLVSLTAPVRAQNVGVNAAVNPPASGTPPGGTVRRLMIGQEVVFNERVITGDVGQTQVVFLDESALSVGPNSDLAVDEFIYDPRANTGKLALSATKGVARFVGGKISKLEPVQLRTPSCTVGIRGGVFLLELLANGRLEVVFLFGDELTVTGLNGTTQSVSRPGWAIVVAGPGASPSAPFPESAARLGELQGELDGRIGGDGGLQQAVSDTTIQGSGISAVVSGNVAASLRAADQASSNAASPVGAGPSGAAGNASNAQSNIGVQNAALSVPVSQGLPTPVGNIANGASGTPYTGVSTVNGAAPVPTTGTFNFSSGIGTFSVPGFPTIPFRIATPITNPYSFTISGMLPGTTQTITGVFKGTYFGSQATSAIGTFSFTGGITASGNYSITH